MGSLVHIVEVTTFSGVIKQVPKDALVANLFLAVR